MRRPAVEENQESLRAPPLYRARRCFGLSAISGLAPIGSTLALLVIGLTGGGCSLSRGSSAFADMEGDKITTGSITPTRVAGPTDADLAFARNAASDVLTKGAKDSSQSWENPATGARGSVTPIASSYVAEGKTCRDFLASYVNGNSESWLQGAACQTGRGGWDIHTLKPWNKT